ncbi:DUF5977 domain-containing protein [Flavobacterium sp. RS13.1]|uniref:DUF5977 domain-containing protein n=1 Tax=Flavobacterium sp. RS13.1 TaxID=3400345 RepID=UPI003AAAA797
MQNKLIKLFVLIILFISVKTQAQTESGFQTPNFAPKSPEAAAFLKYGEYPVDLSTGVPGISIPLYSVDIKDFKLPISLDYHASGIKVAQEATWVGLGWNLNAGAQVVLSPRDGIDENNPYIDQIPDDDEIIAYFRLHPYKHEAIAAFLPELDKSRIKDIYVFSSPTVNGSFYIKNFKQNVVVTIPPDAFKVELLGTSRENMGFKITDIQGNIYSLNTTEVSEKSMTHGDRYISAWYVDEITTPANRKINFTYQDDGTLTDIPFSQKVDIKRRIESEGCAASTSQNQIGAVIDESESTVTTLKKIKEIIFNDGNSKVLFTKKIGRQDLLNGIKNGYLSKIEIQQLEYNEFKNIKGYTFEYSYFNQSKSSYTDKRLKLDKIVNINGRDEEQFVYSNILLPNKRSKGQDYFGYNNGAENNVNMIPKHYIAYPYTVEVGDGDRSVSPSSIQAGILREIHYPTKGWTKFTFENNQFYGIDVFANYNPIIVNSPVIQGTGGSVPVKEGPGIDDGTVCLNPDPNDCVNYVSIPFTANAGTGYLTYQFSKPEGDDPTLFKYHFAKVRVISAGQQVYYSGILVDHKNVQNIPLSNLQSGTIEVAVYGKYYSIRNLQLKYVNNGSVPKNNLGAGLRIKSIENYNHDNSLLLKKEYDYSEITDNTRTSGRLINEMSTTFSTKNFTNYQYVTCTTGDYNLIACLAGVSSESVYSITSNSRFGIEGNSVAYRYVKEKQIDIKNQTNNGYNQYEFTMANDEIPFGNPTVQIQTTWKRGKLLGKKIFKTIGLTNYIVEEEKNIYFEDPARTSFYNGFKMFRNSITNIRENPDNPFVLMCPYYADGGIEVLQSIEPITLNLPIVWYYQKTSEKTNYFYDASNNLTGTLVSTTNFNYSNPSHLQLTSRTTTNSTGQTLQTRYFYADEMPGRPFVNDLKEAHMIGIPLGTQTFNNGEKLSEQFTAYEKSNATNNLLLPKSIYTNKGESGIDLNLDRKITYDQYDDKGNVLQYTPESGIPVSVIWGYNKTQPIAKIDNIAYNSIPAATITNLQTLSNIDSDNCLAENCTEQLLRNALNIFRNSLPDDTFISTYTYNPLVGLTSVTDPKGNTTYYEYDTNGRLKFVKDKDLNVLQKYCYNYKGESVDCNDNSSTTIVLYRSIARSGSFTKNNCASGGVPSTISYSQSVGAATSIISQADADAKGLAKFNTDGQANANANGVCTYYNIAQNGIFTKNDCSSGGIGSSVAYSQAAGVVTSIISQEDANALGIAKLNADGQAYANTNGICTLPLPAAPTGLTLTSKTTTSLNFSWTAVAGATSYKIYKNGQDIGITTSVSTGSLSGLTPDTAYNIQVLAVNAAGDGALSTAVSMRTDPTIATNACVLEFQGTIGSCKVYKNGTAYISRTTTGISSGTLTTGDTFHVTVTASNIYYKGITIISSVRGILYNYAPNKTGASATSPTFTKEGSEEIEIYCYIDRLL